mmetsp:Transcript_13679/g.44604  ORF Transcript_13679/g.44604 Transcript_13679/m.44604 type:complete len:355 (+) Transcript_13679:29-1093(+)
MAAIFGGRVGILGMGKMGSAMAERLLVSGEEAVICWNRSTDGAMRGAGAAMNSARRGAAVVAQTPAHALGALSNSPAGPKVLLLVVSDSAAATDVMKLLEDKGPCDDVTVVNLTSGSPSEGRLLRKLWGGHKYVDASYCGPPSSVRAGAGQIFASADDESLVQDARPVLERLAGSVCFAGPIGASRALDYAVVDLALVTYLSFCSNAALLEKEGVDFNLFTREAAKRLENVPASLDAAIGRMTSGEGYFKDPVVTLGTLRDFWASRLPYIKESNDLPEPLLANFVIDLLDKVGAQDPRLKHADVTRLQELLRFGRTAPAPAGENESETPEESDDDDENGPGKKTTIRVPIHTTP